MSNYNDKLRFAMTPSGFKAGTLYSQFPNVSESDFDVVRSSIGTRVNKDGLIEVMDANVPRLDYSDGGCPKLLTEDSSFINDIPLMKDWVKQRVSTETYADLMGGQDAIKVTSLGGGTSSVYYNIGGINTTRTFSFYCKKGNSRFVTFADQYSIQFIVVADLDNLMLTSVGGSGVFGGIERFNDEWVRIQVTAPISTTTAYVSVSPSDSLSAPQGNYCYVWGYQQESTSSLRATSYFPTSGANATRQADQVINAGNSSTFNSQSGVLFVDVNYKDASSLCDIDISDGIGTNVLRIFKGSFSSIYGQLSDANGIVFNFIDISVSDLRLYNRIALKYSVGDCSLYFNGVKVASDTSVTSISFSNPFSDLSLSKLGTQTFFGKTKSIQHYDYLTDSEMEKLTGYDSYSAMTSQFNFNIL